MDAIIGAVERQCLASQFVSALHVIFGRIAPTTLPIDYMRPGNTGQSQYALGFESQRFLVESPRLLVGFSSFADDCPGAQDIIISPHRFGLLAPRTLLLSPLQPGGNCGDDPFGDLVLHGEEIVHLAIEPLGPNMCASLCVDKLRGDADAV